MKEVQVTIRVPEPGDSLPFTVLGSEKGVSIGYSDQGYLGIFEGERLVGTQPNLSIVLDVPYLILTKIVMDEDKQEAE